MKAAPNRKKLTDLFVRSVKSRDRTFLVWDTQQGKLALQVTPNGTKSWKCVYRFGDRVRWYHIARYPEMGLAEARGIACKLLTIIRSPILTNKGVIFHDPQAAPHLSLKASGGFF